MTARLVAALLSLLGLAGCAMEASGIGAPTTAPAEGDRVGPAGRRALDWLATTDVEMGVDTLVSMQVYGERRGDPRGLEVAALRRDAPSAGDLARYGRLLEIDKTPFPPGSLDGVAPSATRPNPLDTLDDDRIVQCLDEVLACDVSPTCIEYLELDDRWGYVLTHQAVTLVFARWVGCDLAPLDVEARRRTFAANLIAELEADPYAWDLFYERVAMLGELGFASAIDPAWFETILRAQTAEGCFSPMPGDPCHPHPTGVALWALAHAPAD
ncbi:MAG: DUF4735 domain-containing protein [Myxococcales bacterium]|nr:DUF4735 domain-containing protein [Myxococcales bacterium]